MSVSQSKSGYILDVQNSNIAGGGNGALICGGETLGDIALKICDADGTHNILEIEADQGYMTLGKTYAQTLIDNGIVYGVDNNHGAGPEGDFNAQNGGYRIAGNLLSADHLADVDTTTTAPTVGDHLEWNGTNWVPATPSGGGSVFGSEFHTAESSGVSTTTSSSFVQKIKITTASLPAGDYRIEWYAEQNTHKAFIETALRVQVDDTSTCTDYLEHYANADTYYGKSGWHVMTLSAGVHEIDLDHRTDSGSGAGSSIKNARLSIWRTN